jgi:tRNA A22 N-methylase
MAHKCPGDAGIVWDTATTTGTILGETLKKHSKRECQKCVQRNQQEHYVIHKNVPSTQNRKLNEY